MRSNSRPLTALLCSLFVSSLNAQGLQGEDFLAFSNRFSPNTESRVSSGYSYQNGVVNIQSGYVHQNLNGSYDLVLMVNVENKAFQKDVVFHFQNQVIRAEWVSSERECSRENGAYALFLGQDHSQNRDYVILLLKGLPLSLVAHEQEFKFWLSIKMDGIDYLVTDVIAHVAPTTCPFRMRALQR